jgi:hypothetical protein
MRPPGTVNKVYKRKLCLQQPHSFILQGPLPFAHPIRKLCGQFVQSEIDIYIPIAAQRIIFVDRCASAGVLVAFAHELNGSSLFKETTSFPRIIRTPTKRETRVPVRGGDFS